MSRLGRIYRMKVSLLSPLMVKLSNDERFRVDVFQPMETRNWRIGSFP